MLKTKRVKPQIEEIEKRYKKKPDSTLFFPLADAYRKTEDLDKAESLLRKGLTYHPYYWAAKALLGEILYKKGDFIGAKEQVESVLKVVPENIMAQKILLEIYKKEGIDKAPKNQLQLLKLIGKKGEGTASPCTLEEEAEGRDTLLQDTIMTDTLLTDTPDIEEKGGVSPEMLGRFSIEDNQGNEAADLQQEVTDDDHDIAGSSLYAEDESSSLDAQVQEQAEPPEGDLSGDKEHMLEREENQHEIVTATLAELYFSQGLYEKAANIYRKLVKQHPEKGNWQIRLKEIQDLKTGKSAGQPTIRGIDSIRAIDSDHHAPRPYDAEVLEVLNTWLKHCQSIKRSRGI